MELKNLMDCGYGVQIIECPESCPLAAEYDYGGATIFSMIRADDSYLPRSFYFKAKDYYAGYSYDTVAMSFEGWGMNKLLDGVAGPRPGSAKNLWNFDGRRRFTREASAKDRKEIEDAVRTSESYTFRYNRVVEGPSHEALCSRPS